MAWKPKLPVVSTNQLPMERRPWVAVAESQAEFAVNLFANIMRNPKYPVKLRMEAATRIVMLAGATFRGERKDGNGRPAANLPLPSGTPLTRLSKEALREALRQLPEGTVVEDPDEVPEGEAVVVLHDSEHSRKPTGEIVQTTVGTVVIGEFKTNTQEKEEYNSLMKKHREELKEEAKKTPGTALNVIQNLLEKKVI